MSPPSRPGPALTVAILGASGFVGLNLAEALLAAGHDVVGFDRAPPPDGARAVFDALPGRFEAIVGDVTDAAAIEAAIRPGLDGLVLGAAITADAARDAAQPEAILAVNLVALVPILARARRAGVRRIVNLSSGIVYGRHGTAVPLLTEDAPVDPVSLYAITKFASERTGARLADLWDLDLVNVRLGAVFGPWEHPTGLRDTLSPQAQMAALCAAGETALLERPGLRDWVYAPDVAEAVLRLLEAERIGTRLLHVSAPTRWAALDWGLRLAALDPAFACRLAGPGERPNVLLHAAVDRAPLATDRMTAELGWTARFDMARSADHFAAWHRRHGRELVRPR